MPSPAIRQLLAAKLAVCLLLAPTVAASKFQSGDEAAIRALVEHYFAAYAKEDLDAIVQLWSDKSPDLAQAKARLKEFFSLNQQIETRNLSFRQFKVEGDHANALATVDVSGIDIKTGKPSAGLGNMNRALSIVKEAGEWRVWRDISAEEELAARLIAAKSDDERKAILGERPEFVNLGLRKALIEQGVALRAKANFPQALTTFELAQRVAEQINDQTGIAEVSNYLGSVLLAQGKRDLAMESYQKSLALCTTLSEKACIANALQGIGNTHEAKAEHDLAIDFIKRAMTINEESADQPGIAKVLMDLGMIYYRVGNYPQALEAYQRALPILESAGDTQRVAAVRNSVGLVQRTRGEGASAIESYQKSVELYEKLGDKLGLANVNNGIGVVYSQRGDYSSAMRYFQKSLDVYEKLENKRGVADSQGNIGIVQRLQGNYNLALEYQQKVLAFREASGDQLGIARALNNLGLIYTDKGDYSQSLEAYSKSLKLNETLGNKSEVGAVLQNIGVAYRYQGAYDLALEYYRKSLEIREQLGEKGQSAGLLRSIGIAYEQKGDHQQAVTYSERAANLAREIGFREVLSSALTTAGNAHLALGETEKSRAAFEEAIATVEALRGQVAGGPQDQQRFFEGIVSPYYRMVELLAAQGNTTEALSYAERGKARLLLDVLKSGRVNIDRAMTDAERAQEGKIRDSFVLLNTQISAETRLPQPDQKRLSQLKAQLETARLGQQEFQTRLYATHPDLRLHRGEAPTLTLAQAGELLNDATALLEYVVSDDRTLLFVLTAPGRKEAQEPVLKVYDLKIKRKELVDRVQKLNQRIANNDIEYAALASELYESLIAPAREQLKGQTRLVIVPDDILWETPFQALRSPDGRFLIQSAAVSYAPSLTVLREIAKSRKPRSANTLLAMGNPKLAGQTVSRSRNVLMSASFEPLPEAERMVMALSKMYGAKARIYVGAEAREDLLKAEAGNYRILQLATHGVINNVSPMYSHVVLAQGNDAKEDGLLEAWEIMQMDLKADLAVLSACDTARGRIGAGEGVIGLAWALFVAGCPTTIVSQWKVESSSTAELMLEFHRHLLAGESKSEAMRRASLKLMADRRFSHPFYWAGFIVVGNGN
ncbi:MAG TPA: CHAT domain-containing protein [Blastocatellia bacterium]|nr:CHAT domain-containing protein [Blastocatellia bacterium]